MSREDKLRGVDLNKKVSLREYKGLMESKFGKKSINESMLRNMDRSTGGRDKAVATVGQLNNLNAAMKLKAAER